MPSLMDRFTERTRQLFATHRGDVFVDGAMAAAALVALSDGDASIEEGAEVTHLMRVFESLQEHDPQFGLDRYLLFVSRIRASEDGLKEARDAVVRAAKSDPEAAALLLVICQAVSEADGRVIEAERREIRALSNLIDIDEASALNRVLGE